MNNVKYLLIPIVLIFLSVSCKKDKDEIFEGVNEQPAATLNLGATLTASFTGQVLDQSGYPISGATVQLSNEASSTDENGIFNFKDVAVKEKLAFVKVEKAGYFSSGRSLIPTASAINHLKLILLEKELTSTIPSGESQSVSLSSGAAVDFQGKYVTADGSPYEGDVKVYMTYLSPSSTQTQLEMPGMLYAQNSNNEAGVLTTYGMIGVELEGDQGQALQIAAESNATIHMPLDPAQTNHSPDEIPLWFFDDEAGYWIEDGQATLQGGEYVGVVKHFTFWNCDAFNDVTTLSGYTLTANGDTLANQALQITAGTMNSSGQTNSDGSYFSYIPSNTLIEFAMIDDCEIPVDVGSCGPFASGTDNLYDMIIPETVLEIIIIKGSLVDCVGDPLTNGYVSLLTNTYSSYGVVTNGSFSIAITNCTSNTNMDLHAYDFDANLQSEVLTYAISAPATFVGEIQVCEGGVAITQILSYSIDGNSDIEYTSNIECHEIQNGGNPYFEIYPQADTSFMVRGWVFDNGQYDFSLLGPTPTIEILPIDIDLTAPHDITVTLNNYGEINEVVSLNFTGTWTDQSQGLLRTISGYLVVARDT